MCAAELLVRLGVGRDGLGCRVRGVRRRGWLLHGGRLFDWRFGRGGCLLERGLFPRCGLGGRRGIVASQQSHRRQQSCAQQELHESRARLNRRSTVTSQTIDD